MTTTYGEPAAASTCPVVSLLPFAGPRGTWA